MIIISNIELFKFIVTNITCQSHVTTDGQSASMSRCRARSGTCDQILLSVRRLLSESCCLVSVGRPLWREVGSVICKHNKWFTIMRLTTGMLSRIFHPVTGNEISWNFWKWSLNLQDTCIHESVSSLLTWSYPDNNKCLTRYENKHFPSSSTINSA
jgi:hypothetical protein